MFERKFLTLCEEFQTQESKYQIETLALDLDWNTTIIVQKSLIASRDAEAVIF